MPREDRPGIWIVLLVLLISTLSLLGGCKSNRPAEQAAQPPAESQPSTAKDAPAPTYVAVDETALRGFESGADYVVSGKVTSELMEALPGATVAAYGSPPRWSPPAFEQPAPLDTQACDEEGHYQIRLSAPANLWIRVRKEGYASIDVFLPVRDLKTAARDYQLQTAQATVAGFVYDKKSVPIPGALVIANTPPFTILADSPVLLPIGATTDATGKYTFEGLPEGDVSIIASARAYSMQEQQSPLKAGQSDQVNFNLSPASPISFVVKNSRGEVIPYATATAPGNFKIAGGDKRGVIEFAVPLELSPFDCTVAADGFKANTLLLDPKAPPAAVLLEDRPTFKGRVVAESGEAVVGAIVSVFGTGGAKGKFDGAVQTDKTGRFSLLLAYPPVREIRVSRTGYFDQRIAYDNSKPAPPEAAIRMKRVEAGLFGRVIDYRGISVRRFVLHLRNVSAKPGTQEYQRSFSSENGRYMISDVAPGVYTLVLQSVPGSTAEDVQLASLEQVEIRKGFLLGELLTQFPKPKYAK